MELQIIAIIISALAVVLSYIALRDKKVQTSLSDTKELEKRLGETDSKVSVLTERISGLNKATDRLDDKLDKLDDKLDKILEIV